MNNRSLKVSNWSLKVSDWSLKVSNRSLKVSNRSLKVNDLTLCEPYVNRTGLYVKKEAKMFSHPIHRISPCSRNDINIIVFHGYRVSGAAKPPRSPYIRAFSPHPRHPEGACD